MGSHTDIAALAKLLEGSTRVCTFGSKEDPEAWALAHALVDISESCDRICRSLLPALMSAKEQHEIEGVLLDIGEELRHVLYHVKASRFYRYLEEQSCD